MIFHSCVLTSFRSSALSSSPPPIPGFFALTLTNLGATLATGGLWGAEEMKETSLLATRRKNTEGSEQHFPTTFTIHSQFQTTWPTWARTLSKGLFRGFVESWRGGVGCGHGILTLPRLHWVVLLPIVVGVKELLKPLDKLKVVLELPLHQFVYWDDLEAGREKESRPGCLDRRLPGGFRVTELLFLCICQCVCPSLTCCHLWHQNYK